jgi:hypothetical protein
MFSRAGILSRPTSAPAFTGLLDTYSGAAAAYSAARRLSSTYTGSLIRVRRSSDNAEQDIGYTSGNILDESALTSFVGAGNGFVTTWYDQSGNGNNETQSTAADQPRIVNSGTIDKMNSVPTIYFSGGLGGSFLSSSNYMSGSTTGSVFAFTAVDSDPSVGFGSGHFISTIQQSGQAAHCPFSDGNIYESFGTNSRKSAGNPTASLTTPHLYSVVSQLNDYKIYIDNTQFYSTTSNTVSFPNTILVGKSTDGKTSYNYNGKLSELILYPSSPDRTGINTNMNSFYSIYP